MRSPEENNQLIDQAFDAIRPEELRQTRINFDVAAGLHNFMERTGYNSKDLAAILEIDESEFNRWLTAMHSFDAETIAEIKLKLG